MTSHHRDWRGPASASHGSDTSRIYTSEEIRDDDTENRLIFFEIPGVRIAFFFYALGNELARVVLHAGCGGIFIVYAVSVGLQK